jgi:pimeloyl-ACP methyl ester carboxylesterase
MKQTYTPNRLAALAVAFLAVFAAASCHVEIGPGDRAWNDFAAPYRHDIAMGGYRLHYVDVGQGDPVLLVHGYADSTFTFHANVPALAEAGLRALPLDLPGLGRSELPPEPFVYSIENLSAEVVKFADKLHLDRFAVAGSSMGGGIALYLAEKYPERVTRIVPIDPACFSLAGHRWMPLLKYDSLARIGTHAAGRATIAIALHDVFADSKNITSAVVDEYARPLNKPGFRDLLRRLLVEYFSPEFMAMTQRYDQIRAPTLLIWGAGDKWVPTAFGPKLQALIAGSRLTIVPHAGHLPQQERPDIVNPLLVEFLKEK